MVTLELMESSNFKGQVFKDNDSMQHTLERQRLDKWLWAARFYKTRGMACEEIQKNRVDVNDQVAKPARELKVGDTVTLRQGHITRTVVVNGLIASRGPATVAHTLYQETPESLQKNLAQRESRRLAPEPAHSIEQGRPTKRERRHLDQAQSPWNDRWSATLD
jgi:ribosome-associated heat shock protein Hsp15